MNPIDFISFCTTTIRNREAVPFTCQIKCDESVSNEANSDIKDQTTPFSVTCSLLKELKELLHNSICRSGILFTEAENQTNQTLDYGGEYKAL